MTEPLNLSGADLRGFEPIDSGTYEMAITQFEKVFTKNEGKMPADTPGWNVRFTVQGGQFDDRHVWNNYWLPTADYENSSDEAKKKTATMRGMFAKFLIAIGYSEKEIMGGKFKLDPDDVVGRKCSAVVGIKRSEEYGDRNIIRNVKPLRTLDEAGIL